VSKKQILILLSFFNLILFCFYFFLKIYFQPIAIVVPHHNFVKEQRLNLLNQISKRRLLTKKIIILSPDHFSFNQLSLSYADTNWGSSDVVKFAQDFEDKLKQNLTLRNNIVEKDHGIFNLIPDIQKIWPKAEIFPILIGQNYPVSGLNNLISDISNTCKYDCLLISSVDFSHYLPAALAEIHDQKSIKELNNQNLTKIPKLEVDSPQSLYVLASFAKNKNAKKWDLFFNSNSGKLSNNFDIETTSYVIGSYQRSFSKNNTITTETYLISKNIDKKKSLSSLGSRFFYGTDYIDLNYSSDSEFILPFDLPKNMVVSVVKNNNSTDFTFFPTETKNGSTFLLRGLEKESKAIKSISLPN
jgi:MEMO1 family protein